MLIDDKTYELSQSISKNTSEIKERLAKVETTQAHIIQDIEEIKKSVSVIPDINARITAISEKLDASDEKKKWWHNSYFSPIVTGVIIGIVLLIAEIFIK